MGSDRLDRLVVARYAVFGNTNIDVGPDGVKDFYWPISLIEKNAMRDSLLAGICQMAKSKSPQEKGERNIFSSVSQLVAREHLRLVFMIVVSQRTRRQGKEPVWPAGETDCEAIWNGQPPKIESSPIIKHLRTGPQRTSGLRRFALRLKYDTAFNGFGFSTIRSRNPSEDVYACHITQVMEAHARTTRQTVKHTAFDEWFEPISSDRSYSSHGLSEALMEEIYENLTRVFEQLDEAVPSWLSRYNKAFVGRVSSLARIHLNRLESRCKDLPRELWTGTGAYVWARLLRHAVRRAGGIVVGHEHGTGECIINYFNTKTFSDLESADRFVTFNSNQRAWLEEMIDEKFLVPNSHPTIEVPSYEDNFRLYAGKELKGHRKMDRTNKSKTIMYVGPIYCGFRPRLSHHNCDPVMVDWQARLFTKLASWNCDVLIKPHPEGEQRPPAQFYDFPRVKFIEGPFESVWNKADMLIFDWKTTTAFSTAMSTGLPIIMVDFSFENFTPEMQKLVEDHCKIVEGTHDEDNRLHVDWRELKEAILCGSKQKTSEIREKAFRFK
jgi:hypothetical protein